jgi:hypothetical protein
VTVHAVTWGDVPACPAVYAMYGGERPRTWVAYVGLAGELQGRLIQHFVRRDSSVVTRSSAVGVNIDRVVHVDWWEHPSFADVDSLHAAELIASEILQPALVSRGGVRRTARALAADQAFRSDIESLFKGRPQGRYRPPRIGEVARQLRDLEQRVEALEKHLSADSEAVGK